jgi:hypothetical protein
MESDPIFGQSPEGRTFRPGSQAEIDLVLDEAFHYRGDVTLHLISGEHVEGYLFNREPEATPASLQMYLQGEAVPRLILYSEVVAVTYSGQDTASGKSWEAWMSKKERPPKS